METLMKLYSVLDKEAGDWSQPNAQHHDVAALRMFAQAVNRHDEGNMLNHAPEHFSLWRIGYFDTSTGVLTPELTKLTEATAIIRPTN